MQVCTLLQTDNHASNPPLSFLQAGCPSCRPTNSVKALKGLIHKNNTYKKQTLVLNNKYDKYTDITFLQMKMELSNSLHVLVQ